MWRRALRAGLLAPLLLVIVAGPAAADPAGPTNTVSTITDVTGPDGEPVDLAEHGVELRVVGGDSFLAASVEPGETLQVPGYEGEPYLRFGDDGTVEVNERSPARWLNDARLGAAEVDVPPQADPEAAPAWTTVATGGAYAWHDHRIHWMSPSLPAHVDTASSEQQRVMEWEAPLVVGDEELTLSGVLDWRPGPPTALPVALVAVAVLAMLALAWWRGVPAAALAGGVSLPALAVGLDGLLSAPPGAEGDVSLAVLPGLALLLAALGVALARRDPGRSRGPLLGAAAGLPLLVFGALWAGALTRPVVPGSLPVEAQRAVVALALGAGIAGLTVLARASVRAAPAPLDDPDGPDAVAGGSGS